MAEIVPVNFFSYNGYRQIQSVSKLGVIQRRRHNSYTYFYSKLFLTPILRGMRMNLLEQHRTRFGIRGEYYNNFVFLASKRLVKNLEERAQK